MAKEQIKLNRGSFFASLSACSGKLSYETKDNVLSFQSDAVSGKIDFHRVVAIPSAYRSEEVQEVSFLSSQYFLSQ